MTTKPINDEVWAVCDAVMHLENSVLEGESGTVGCLQNAVHQLFNDPKHEPNLKNVLVAAIAFHTKERG